MRERGGARLRSVSYGAARPAAEPQARWTGDGGPWSVVRGRQWASCYVKLVSWYLRAVARTGDLDFNLNFQLQLPFPRQPPEYDERDGKQHDVDEDPVGI